MVAAKRNQVESLELEQPLLGVEALSAKLDERLPAFEKRVALAALGALGDPRAVGTLRAYLAEPDPGLERDADRALERALAASPEGRGYDRNSPCPCGSGNKWKHCCAGERIRWSDERRTRQAEVSAPWRSR